MAVTISWLLRKIVTARSTVTEVSTGMPVWSMPETRSVSRGSCGLGLMTYLSRTGAMDLDNVASPAGFQGIQRGLTACCDLKIARGSGMTGPLERWPSGLRRSLGKRVYGKPYRG